MARLVSPVKKTFAVFVRQGTGDGRVSLLREPYNIVSLDYGDGTPINTYLELTLGKTISPLERQEVYDDIRIYDFPPYSGVRIGYGAPGA